MKQKDDECDAVGHLVAHKLRRMSMDQRDIFESLMHKMIAIGLKGNLTTNTDLMGYHGCTSTPVPPVPSAPPVPSGHNWQVNNMSQSQGNTSWSVRHEPHQSSWFHDSQYTNL